MKNIFKSMVEEAILLCVSTVSDNLQDVVDFDVKNMCRVANCHKRRSEFFIYRRAHTTQIRMIGWCEDHWKIGLRKASERGYKITHITQDEKLAYDILMG